MTATLTERIAARQPQQPPKVVSLRPTPLPTWRRRMAEQGLPVQDRTSYVLGAFRPAGDHDAA